jgi:glycosyltransferase involved in cell wall biosynthesis
MLGYAYHSILAVDKSEVIEERSGYLFHMGRLVTDKGAHHAMKISEESGMPLIIAGPQTDQAYFDEYIDKPHVEKFIGKSPAELEELIADVAANPMKGGKPRVIYVGPVNDEQKAILFKHAEAFVNSMTNREALGLVNIESMSHGTPVFAFASSGVAKELIKEGQGTGFVLEGNAQEASAGVVQIIKSGGLSEINHTHIREVYDADWSTEQEALALRGLYEKFIETNKTKELGISAEQVEAIRHMQAKFERLSDWGQRQELLKAEHEARIENVQRTPKKAPREL